MNDEGKRNGPRMRWLVDHHVRPLADALRGRVEAAERRGTLPPIHPVSVHDFVVGTGLVFSQAPECAYLTGVDPNAEGFAEAHADAGHEKRRWTMETPSEKMKSSANASSCTSAEA